MMEIQNSPIKSAMKKYHKIRRSTLNNLRNTMIKKTTSIRDGNQERETKKISTLTMKLSMSSMFQRLSKVQVYLKTSELR